MTDDIKNALIHLTDVARRSQRYAERCKELGLINSHYALVKFSEELAKAISRDRKQIARLEEPINDKNPTLPLGWD